MVEREAAQPPPSAEHPTSNLPVNEMSEDQHQFLLLLGQLPARLTVEQAAWVLNCQPHDVPVLLQLVP